MAFWRKQQITILLTNKCNLACTYCYMPKDVPENHQTIDVEFAKKGIEDFFRENESRCVRFFGSGEPTLAFREMKELAGYARSIVKDKVTFELETNGYFEGDVADWIENNIDILWISFDGPPRIQDKQRPTINGNKSSHTVIKNIKRFVGSRISQVGIRATISKDNLNKQTKIIEYSHKLGVKNVAACPEISSKSNPGVQTPSLLEFAKGFVPAFRLAKELGMSYLNLMMVNFDEEVNIYCQACLPTPRLTTDGFVSCCDWASFGPEYLPGAIQTCIYGSWNKNTKEISYDKNKINQIKKRDIRYNLKEHCDKCRAEKHCAGGCIGKVMSKTNNFYVPDPNWCKAVKHLWDNLGEQDKLNFFHP